ncbi:serine/threonine protein phosphatase [Xanthomonas phaseoli pv. phaseoli]|uniref:Membrane associated phosphatase n=1 Tax=Xanthomonas campestris pv. phaseoli TaxID=317013 RepID=A0AB38E198_XANCH|nr:MULTISPECIES: phosphatase PAP2/dual specificity phosphatase family protein [Xanthomonas]ATS23674.1 phosphatase PAP2/dual specificity phosphatase family protein [Xanthomonas phaseoli pv. phaseoli]ATS26565.1 phosphatase PAP2/dual specificity phosphatase family protein [Xanthomonas phaseoli pv. phaseoli]ATS29956.1 phosphatase PAP2/dual specificity phosphatase family protein [Xanthomonas phaseoli pv. phaseoli]ATS34828.1 phosphatase PAP2/dual specificity phosphatase family protein [Xanthomonas ph
MSQVARPFGRAALWLALLGPFFFLSYGLANTLAGRAAQVPSVVFGWEHGMPFWPWTIVPYWSIDVFYAVSFFVCRNRRELDTHARRLLSAQLICVACFLLWPLRYSFVRPQTEGVFGWLFAVLLGFDKPFNQAPSLHIVLLVVLWVRYAQHLCGVWRWLLHGWFALIGVSVLTTYQHHFLDIPTGLAVGWLCVWLWPERIAAPFAQARCARDLRRWRLAVMYLAGALVSAALALWSGGAALWLLWITLALLLVALNYALLGPGGFQKRSDGCLSLAARWLYAPYLLAAWCNSRLWTRRAPSPRAVCDGVWLGRIPLPGQRDKRAAVVDVSAELSLYAAQAQDRVVPMLDLVAPSPAQLREAAQAIAQAQANGPVLVCCALGYSRSAASVATWLVRSGRAQDADAAIAQLRTVQPSIVLGHAHRAAIVVACDVHEGDNIPERRAQ